MTANKATLTVDGITQNNTQFNQNAFRMCAEFRDSSHWLIFVSENNFMKCFSNKVIDFKLRDFQMAFGESFFFVIPHSQVVPALKMYKYSC